MQNRSPWFTGIFNTAWQIKGAPVIPSIPRKDNNIDPQKTNRKAPVRQKPIYTSLVKMLYIGNKAEYAGFVINAMVSPYDGNMYEDLFKKKPSTDIIDSHNEADVVLRLMFEIAISDGNLD